MKKLIFTLLIAICSSSYAEWEINDINNEFTIFIDRKTIRKNGSIVKMWTMSNYVPSRVYQGKQFKSDKIYRGFDCNSEMQVVISVNYFSDEMGKGILIFGSTRQEKDWEWGVIVPETIGEDLWKIACGKK